MMITGTIKKLIFKFFTFVNNNKFGRKISDIFAKTLFSSIKVVHCGGVQIQFVTPNQLCLWRVETFFEKEPETIEWINNHSEDDVLWDVGANIGLYSCYAAAKNNCQVYAFEPSVFNLELLARNIFINGLADKISIVPFALTDKASTGTLRLTSTDWGGALSTFHEDYGADGKPLKPLFLLPSVGMRLDDVSACFGIPAPDHLKIDVDGIEHLILSGGLIALQNVKSVLVEVNDSFLAQSDSCARILTDAGLVLTEKKSGFAHDDLGVHNQIWYREHAG